MSDQIAPELRPGVSHLPNNSRDFRGFSTTPETIRYEAVERFVEESNWERARQTLAKDDVPELDAHQRAITLNDRGVIAALEGNVSAARARFAEALTLDPDCAAARENVSLLDRWEIPVEPTSHSSRQAERNGNNSPRATRVAILSLLFNWPSTGGGTIHTAETGKFLNRAGYEVQHIFAVYPEWGLGKVTEPTGVPSVPLEFSPADWNAAEIQRRFRASVDDFQPDYVIITDSWNTKPLLAEAVTGYRYFLRLAALECLCPLNNVRLLVNDRHEITSCPRNQLATPDLCRQCVHDREHTSGSLHQVERVLAGFWQPDYAGRLRKVFAEAERVLAVNPLIATMVSPFTDRVHVVPSGFDADRFPDPAHRPTPHPKTRLFFAGLVDEYMKGFHVLRAACERLWGKRQDFELWATGESAPDAPPFLHSVGWLKQDELPRALRDADCLIFPTIAEEALGRSAVEAMGAGIPVIASRIGGLPFTVTEGLTGLLFEPGDVDDLAEKIETLLDDPELRRRLGAAGRMKFEQEFTWDAILDRHYRRLLPPIAEIPSAPVDDPAAINSAGSMTPDQALIEDAAKTFGLPPSTARQMYDTFCAFQRSAEWGAAAPTMNLTSADGFLLSVLLSLTRPDHLVLVGNQAAALAARISALRALVGLDVPIICYVESTSEPGPLPPDVDARYESAEDNVRTEILDPLRTGLIVAAGASLSLLDELEFEIRAHYGLWSLAVVDPDGEIANSSGDRSDSGAMEADEAVAGGAHGMHFFRASPSLVLFLPSSLGLPAGILLSDPVAAAAPP